MKITLLKAYFVALAACLGLMMQSCGARHEWQAELTLKGLGTQDVVAMIMTDDRVDELTIMGVDDIFTVDGSLERPAMVELFTKNGVAVGCFVASPGEKMKLTIEEGVLTSVGKSKANIALMEFQRSVAGDISSEELNAKVAEAVERDPKSPVAGLIFSYYYNVEQNPSEAADLLARLMDGDGRPSPMLAHQTSRLAAIEALADSMPDGLEMIVPGDSLLPVDFKAKPLTITYISSTTDRSSDTIPLAISPDWHKKEVGLIVVRANLDTINWEKHRLMYKRDDVSHYWSPGGLDLTAGQRIAIDRYPAWIVSDSTGSRLYHAAEADSVISFVDNLLSR